MELEPKHDFFSSRQCNICLLTNVMREAESTNLAALTEQLQLDNEVKELRQCNACHLIVYCGKEHQKLDWSVHKPFCRAVQKVLNSYQIKHPFYLSYNGPPRNKHDMERTILQAKFIMMTQLNRGLHFHEEELMSFPSCCNLCYTFKEVTPCKACHGISYCSVDHAQKDLKEHSKVCPLLKLYYCPYKVIGVPQNMISDLAGVAVNLQATDLFDAFQCATQRILPDDPTASLEKYQLFAMAGSFSCIATICFALSFVNVNAFNKTNMVIFIVGASVERETWFRKIHTQFFFLQYPQIECLELFFIGPEATELAERRINYKFMSRERTVYYKSKRMYFENFHEFHNVKPSLIIAYNCGFSEHSNLDEPLPAKCTDNSAPYNQTNSTTSNADLHTNRLDTWPLGIQQMIQTFDLPIVFTSFTSMEADCDYAAFMRVAMADKLGTQVERIFSVQQNPYRDMRPIRRISLRDREEIFYRNNYIQAFQCFLKN